MEEHNAVDDQSHYEISLTAGQAFVAFVLLLLSLAASFAFGLMLGKGQADERLVVRKETPVVNEGALIPKKNSGEIVELGVTADDFEEAEENDPAATASGTDTTVTSTAAPMIAEETTPVTAATITEAPPQPPPVTTPVVAPVATPAHAAHAVPHIAQLLSTGDQKIAEALAVKVINRGFNNAYVERGSTDKGPVYRVRVRFASEGEARAAEPKLREFSKEVWITAK